MKNSTNGINCFGFLKNHLDDHKAYAFAIIIAQSEGQWVFVRHRERKTWELPAGHVEDNETVFEAAHRELFEETGAKKYDIRPIVSYRGSYKGNMVSGMIFFAAIQEFGDLPQSEIAEKKLFASIPKNLTYPDIQPKMIQYYLNL